MLTDLFRKDSLWPWQRNSAPWFKWESNSQCTWRVVLTYYSKVNTNQVNEVRIAFVGSEYEVVFRWKKIVKTDKEANDNGVLNGVMEEDSWNTLLMEVQIIFAELSPNSFALALRMIYPTKTLSIVDKPGFWDMPSDTL